MSLKQELDHLFNPRSVAVIGASNKFGRWGFTIFSRLIGSNGGREIYAVNNKEAEVLGVKAYKSIDDIPGTVDFAVIIVPFQDIPEVMRGCVRKGVRSAVIISSGLAETSVEGAKIQQEVVEIARQGGIRFVGPNCMGHFSMDSDFFTVAFLPPVKKGGAALISHTGNGSLSVFNYGVQMGLGFSKYVSSGNEADLHFEDYLEYLAEDSKTDVILGYVEGLREGRRFFELAREITRKKPIVVMKAGRTDAGGRAVRSHSGALAGSDVVCEMAFKQSGVIRVEEISELVDVGVALLGQPLPRGRRVGVLAMAGGLAVMSADAVRREGLEMPSFSPATMEKLNSFLTRRWSRGNPIDPGGEFNTYYCLWPLLEDENIDAIIVVGGFGVTAGVSRWIKMPPSQKYDLASLGAATEDAELKNLEKSMELMKKYQKPVIFATMVTGAEREGKSYELLKENHLNPYPSLEKAVKVLGHLVRYSEYLGVAREE